MRKINSYEEVFGHILDGMYNYFKRYNIHNLVLGLSGGLDSTVVAALTYACKDAYPELNLKLIGVSLPSSTNKRDERVGASKCKVFCDEFIEIPIQGDFDEIRETAQCYSNIEQTPLADGNIKARIRMIHLYNIAGLRNGIVLDTDNLTENYLGFFTIHGDVADVNPIGDLWKNEVYKLAKWMKDNYFTNENLNFENNLHKEALQAAIDIVPTDGNGVKDGGDLAQIAPGYTYEDVDEVLWQYINGYKNYPSHIDTSTIENIVHRMIRTDYKRQKLPIKIGLPSYLWDPDYDSELGIYTK